MKIWVNCHWKTWLGSRAAWLAMRHAVIGSACGGAGIIVALPLFHAATAHHQAARAVVAHHRSIVSAPAGVMLPWAPVGLPALSPDYDGVGSVTDIAVPASLYVATVPVTTAGVPMLIGVPAAPTDVPEPSGFGLMLLGMAALAMVRRRG
jgi:hypothetical protein